MKKNDSLKYGLIEIDFLAQRYGLNPVDLFNPNCENQFLRLSYMKKIAEISVEYENEKMDEVQQQVEEEQIRKEMEAKMAEQQLQRR